MSEDFQSKVIFLATQTITKRQSDILRKLLAGKSLALERGNAWIGDERTSQRTIDALLRFCAISTDWSGRGCEYYTINGTGKEILRRLEKEQ